MSIWQQLTDRQHNCMCKINNAELYVAMRPLASSLATTTYICNPTMCNSISPSKTMAEHKASSCNTTATAQACPTISNSQQKCTSIINRRPCTTILTQSTCLPHTTTTTTTVIPSFSLTTNCSITSTSYGGGRDCTSTITTTITPSFSTAENSSTLGATHGGYIAVILVLLAIIITLVVLVGYLVRRTTAQRGTVQTTEQPLTDMAAAAGDYCEPVALRQLQTSTEPGNHHIYQCVCVCVCVCDWFFPYAH